MKQIIVNVADLTIEEKQRVNEALAKIQNIPKIENVTTGMAWFYGPSSFDSQVGWSGMHTNETPTHTPQQVLELAGMEPSADPYVFLADALIFTDSLGNIIYVSTLKEEKKGHVHAVLMKQYAEDAKTHSKPWELWQFKGDNGDWLCCRRHPHWANTTEYRRKPKIHVVNGVEIPELRVSPEYGDGYYLASTSSHTLYSRHTFVGDTTDMIWAERGLTYQFTDEGMQAAILHSKAMLGID